MLFTAILLRRRCDQPGLLSYIAARTPLPIAAEADRTQGILYSKNSGR